jgi:hypothetical protein
MRTKEFFAALVLLFLCNIVPIAKADDTTCRVTEQTNVAGTGESDEAPALESASLLLLGCGLTLAGWSLKRLRVANFQPTYEYRSISTVDCTGVRLK